MAKIKKFIKGNPTILFGVRTLFAVGVIWGIIFIFFLNNKEGYWSSVFVEFSGFILDVIVVLVIFEWFRISQEKKQKISYQQEIIDDFKKWDTKEGNLRIAGAIRRINREGKTDINLSGLIFTREEFSFIGNDIKDLSGSSFMGSKTLDALWGSTVGTSLENVSFADVNCSNVCFCDSGILGKMYFKAKNIDFRNTNLTNAKFSGACLEWDNAIEKEEDWGEVEEDADGGVSFTVPIYLPAFQGANLTNTSFQNAQLTRADFRGAENIELADFTGAKGLVTCFFDKGMKEATLRLRSGLLKCLLTSIKLKLLICKETIFLI